MARARAGARLRVGVGVRVKVGFKDSVGVPSGQNLTLGPFGAHGLLRAAPLATDCWLEAPREVWGGGGGQG